MPKLPNMSGKELIKLLVEKAGYSLRSQKGSHVILVHPSKKPITVPLHREIKKGTLKGILKVAGISEELVRE